MMSSGNWLKDEIIELRLEIEQLQAENARLQAVVARLPKTFDGEPVICDGMLIACPRGHEHALTYASGRLYCCRGVCWEDGCQGDSGSGTYYKFSECLSTEERQQ